MKFLSILSAIGKGIGAVAQVEQPIAPLVSAIPVFGPIANTVLSGIAHAENMAVQMGLPSGSGATKQAIAVQAIATIHPTLDKPTLMTVINDWVAVVNALDKVANDTQAMRAVAPTPIPVADSAPASPPVFASVPIPK